MAYLEGRLHGGALEEVGQTYPGYLVLATSGSGLLISHKAKAGALLSSAAAGLFNAVYLAKLALLILPQMVPLLTCLHWLQMCLQQLAPELPVTVCVFACWL